MMNIEEAFKKLYQTAHAVLDEAERCMNAEEDYGADFGAYLLHLGDILAEVQRFKNGDRQKQKTD